ncbi:hypothetical protein RHGRI_012421 [Rhododendron griersonianum]|uniref:F-box associated beta-propeller type 3 domain-containing protein n=1 Tax=Rhododendron griersonianum TaxID=479676 RepID=A0AAV6KR09_9ERIC|nr:hypothetical protein RHGRI_012421 [Rhododendron griersonianum]
MDYQAPDHAVAELEMPCKSGVHICGSSNGVILLYIDDELCLWNPSIRIYQKFSQPERPDYRSDIIYGLGYDSISDDFKVVAAVFPVSDYTSVVHVFSSKLSSWKRIGDFCHSLYVRGPECVLNGAPH